MKQKLPGLLLALAIAIPAYFLGKLVPVVGGPVFAIVIGMALSGLVADKHNLDAGIGFTSKKMLQYAVILLGFGLNLKVVLETGKESLPIILATISTSLILAYIVSKVLRIPSKIGILVGVGSSICGGSAIAATAPVIDAEEKEVAQAISVIFLYNVIAAVIFPILGQVIGFSTTDPTAFGIFAGTAVNDTSSVTAAASTWDSLFGLGTGTLDKAVTVKLTRTLAIIPITLALSIHGARQGRHGDDKPNFRSMVPSFIIYFVLASVLTTVVVAMGGDAGIFAPLKDLSKFFIIMAMAAIGLKTNPIHLIRTGGKALLLGLICWIGITGVSLIMQHMMGLW
ncbi:YeiH family protein [Peptoniphilus equinus]|uniref:YeiH family protein n=1 Tax=Peptoniphilus equinus TaxID=3016343 RepID=A0ABY7QV90_9FIRM|nr:YeiH family protein [Peptoniphilus equinus]WBW50251.1 YeiH family protein [Peptoniphilus equinus]